MNLPATYSRRKRAGAGPQSDVYTYEAFPPKLRTQIAQILSDAIGDWEYNHYAEAPQNGIWSYVAKSIRRELGVNSLVNGWRDLNPQDELTQWMAAESDIDHYLDALEYLMRGVDQIVRDNYRFRNIASQDATAAIVEINARILEAGHGYQYENGEIIRLDSLLIHNEVVVPALVLTSDSDFITANGEYLKAHEAFRHRDYETCLTECAKAFESTLKVIASERGWSVQATDPASKLIDAAVDAGFLKPYMTAGFTSLRTMLASGVPTVRNKTAAHGAGKTPRIVPKELAAFQLHQSAAAIVFLITSHKAQP